MNATHGTAVPPRDGSPPPSPPYGLPSRPRCSPGCLRGVVLCVAAVTGCGSTTGATSGSGTADCTGTVPTEQAPTSPWIITVTQGRAYGLDTTGVVPFTGSPPSLIVCLTIHGQRVCTPPAVRTATPQWNMRFPAIMAQELTVTRDIRVEVLDGSPTPVPHGCAGTLWWGPNPRRCSTYDCGVNGVGPGLTAMFDVVLTPG